MTMQGVKNICKYFTVALKMFDAFNKKQMYDSVIMGVGRIFSKEGPLGDFSRIFLQRDQKW